MKENQGKKNMGDINLKLEYRKKKNDLSHVLCCYVQDGVLMDWIPGTHLQVNRKEKTHLGKGGKHDGHNVHGLTMAANETCCDGVTNLEATKGKSTKEHPVGCMEYSKLLWRWASICVMEFKLGITI